jgi:DNA polymerase III delta prime subunit
MEIENLNKILNREDTVNKIKEILLNFETNHKNMNYKKGIYLYGSPGCGKTHFVMNILKELDYDIIKYDAGDVRNKSLIDTITSNNVSNQNVLQMMSKTRKKIAIVMDEIDGMNNGDKGGITSLIKLIRQKKTKKQKMENMTLNPIICIGNYYVDKKIKELMKVCNVFELKQPTSIQIGNLLENIQPSVEPTLMPSLLSYIQGDMRKLKFIQNINNKKPELMNIDTITNIFHNKSYNEDAKTITKTLLNKHVHIDQHNVFMNETDRTIVALLWHENIIDVIDKLPQDKSIPLYLKLLENMCFADYTDRITFQNQIWQFNEMSSLIKTFHNNKIYHDAFSENETKINDIRFTKVLTKYSTEYNNFLFIYNLTQGLSMDRKDLVAFFQELRLCYGENFYNDSEKMIEIEKIFENYDINKLDIKRMYRYLDKNVKKDIVNEDENIDDNEDDDL